MIQGAWSDARRYAVMMEVMLGAIQGAMPEEMPEKMQGAVASNVTLTAESNTDWGAQKLAVDNPKLVCA
jgi:hypothetical protein